MRRLEFGFRRSPRRPAESREVIAFGPAGGGVGDSFRSTVRFAGSDPAWSVSAHTVVAADVAIAGAVATITRNRKQILSAAVVHVEFGSNDRALFWLALLSIGLGRRVAVVIHDYPALAHRPAVGLVSVNRPWRARIGHRVLSPALDSPLRSLLLRGASVVCVFNDEARTAWEPLTRRDVVVLPHGEFAASLDGVAPSDGDYVLFAGFIGHSKGVDLLLNAWHQLGAHGGLRLVIAGDAEGVGDEAFQALREQSLSWENPPEWIGFIEGEGNLQRLIARSALVVMPYRASSPASGILVRAMAEGRPIVGTRVPALTSSLRDGVDGLLCAPGDVTDLANNLRRLVLDPNLRDELGRSAADHATELFSTARQVELLADAYESALTQGERQVIAAA